MGNEMGTLLTKCKHKRHRREIKLVTLKVTRSDEVDDDEEIDEEEEYSTPKSHLSELRDEDNIVDSDDVVVDDIIQVPETGQSSNSETNNDGYGTPPSFVCSICVELRPLYDSFNAKGCSHFYCTSCITSYVASKLEDNITNISCPESNCEAMLGFDDCRLILPDDVFVRWGVALCESAVVGNKKFYCPYKDCSALLINEGGGVVIKQSVCPFCRRLVCVRCKIPWHQEFDCSQFQKLKRRGEDAMMVDLAKKKKWKRCPNCNYFVEKSAGCFYMKCRCGYAFCYSCGARSSANSHQCPSCKR